MIIENDCVCMIIIFIKILMENIDAVETKILINKSYSIIFAICFI
jgi:hypothetical protein